MQLLFFWLNFNDDVDITLRSQLIPDDAAEQTYLANTISLGERCTVLLQYLQGLLLVH